MIWPHRHRWYVTGVEHLDGAPGQDPPHGWSVIKRACWAHRCAELGASVLAGTWSLSEARGLMPWALGRAGRREPVALAGGLGGVARQRAADPQGAEPDPAMADLPGPYRRR